MAAKKAAAKKKPSLSERIQALNPVRNAQRRNQAARNARIDEASGLADERKKKKGK
jgi:hypothetical protein